MSSQQRGIYYPTNQLYRHIIQHLGELCVYEIRILMPIIYTDPHLSKRAEASKNTSTDPCTVFALRRCKDLDPHIFHSKSLYLMQQSVTESFGQG